jgi:hypothetical protein
MELNISSLRSDPDLYEFMIAVVAVIAFMFVFFLECKVYDLSTAAFFSWALGLLARGRIVQYLAVFAAANINRETSLLLAVVFAVYEFRRMSWSRYLLLMLLQLMAAGAIRYVLMAIYAGNPGMAMLVRPLENLHDFLFYPGRSVLHWAVIGVVTWLCLRRWTDQPRILQVAFLVLAPTLMVLYLMLGWAFELRVFAEIYPVVWVMLWKL